MKQAAKEITPAEAIVIIIEEMVAEAKEEVLVAPSSLRAILRDLEAIW